MTRFTNKLTRFLSCFEKFKADSGFTSLTLMSKVSDKILVILTCRSEPSDIKNEEQVKTTGRAGTKYGRNTGHGAPNFPGGTNGWAVEGACTSREDHGLSPRRAQESTVSDLPGVLDGWQGQ